MSSSAVADAKSAAQPLTSEPQAKNRNAAWLAEVRAAVAYRPPAWDTLVSRESGKLHPVELCRALAAIFAANDKAVLVCDGGEIGQWPQAMLAPRRRIINGPAGSIGSSIPFAIAARAADPQALVIAVMGDGTFGFHMAEFDTAVRCNLPFVAVVGNDATWNAEHQIQLREYGPERTHGCGCYRRAMTWLPRRWAGMVNWSQALPSWGRHWSEPSSVASPPVSTS